MLHDVVLFGKIQTSRWICLQNHVAFYIIGDIHHVVAVDLTISINYTYLHFWKSVTIKAQKNSWIKTYSLAEKNS